MLFRSSNSAQASSTLEWWDFSDLLLVSYAAKLPTGLHLGGGKPNGFMSEVCGGPGICGGHRFERCCNLITRAFRKEQPPNSDTLSPMDGPWLRLQTVEDTVRPMCAVLWGSD